MGVWKEHMTRIVITNVGTKLNKGNAAVLNSRIKILSEVIPDANFTVFTSYPRINYDQYDIKMLSVIGPLSPRSPRTLITLFLLLSCGLWSVLHKYLGLNVNILIYEKRLQEYANADIVIDAGGDIFVEDNLFGFLTFLNNLLFAILLNKPVVIYAESIKTKSKLGTLAARFVLNRVSLITLREEISKKHLQEIGINKPPIYVTADSAFLLEPVSQGMVRKILLKEGIDKNNRPLIGMSVSMLISRYYSNSKSPEEKLDKYVKLMAQVVDYLTDRLNATVVFVPHVIGPGNNDDRIVAKKICQIVKSKHRVISITNEYTPEELKGIIGECDLFIGARMHATIASTSMHVPTIGIAYSHKMYGIIGEMLGHEKYICDIKTLDFDTLTSIIDDIWSNREKIKNELIPKVKVAEELALLNGKLVNDLLESSQCRK